jgi:hypothetical protein
VLLLPCHPAAPSPFDKADIVSKKQRLQSLIEPILRTNCLRSTSAYPQPPTRLLHWQYRCVAQRSLIAWCSKARNVIPMAQPRAQGSQHLGGQSTRRRD